MIPFLYPTFIPIDAHSSIECGWLSASFTVWRFVVFCSSKIRDECVKFKVYSNVNTVLIFCLFKHQFSIKKRKEFCRIKTTSSQFIRKVAIIFFLVLFCSVFYLLHYSFTDRNGCNRMRWDGIRSHSVTKVCVSVRARLQMGSN